MRGVEHESEGVTEQLNRSCRCVAVDAGALAGALESGAGTEGLYASILRDQPHLFSASAVFLSRRHLERMQEAVAAITRVVAMHSFQEAALATAPAVARIDHGPLGVFLGYDFHLGADGPRLIEINTNAGGALLNIALARAQRACCAEVERAVAPPGVEFGGGFGDEAEAGILAMFRHEWSLQRGDAPLASVAIVDEDPASQYLYPEFLMFRELFEKAGIEARILDPRELSVDAGGRLSAGGRGIDLVYNRLTDFSLEEPANAALLRAWETGGTVITPTPRAHALHADKRHLATLSDPAALAALGVDAATIATLEACVPHTVLLGDDNREELWKDRRRWFFKPAGGYGSKAAYRGDKLTRGVWEEMRSRSCVAQRIVPPSERTVVVEGEEVPLKLDVRCYVYDGVVQLVASRLYRGQTTNFRTLGGGFAPVFTEAPAAAS